MRFAKYAIEIQMPASPKELSGIPDFPAFSDRLPDLILAVRTAAQDLSASKPTESYLPYIEDLYLVLHGLKGSLNLIKIDKPMETFVLRFCELLSNCLQGELVIRDKAKAGSVLDGIREILEHPQLQHHEGDDLQQKLDQLEATTLKDIPHAERIKLMPSYVFYVNDLVSKKAREVSVMKFNDCVVEDTVMLEQIPFWRAQLNNALHCPEFGRGIVVNFLPLLSHEGSRSVKLWAWVAAGSLSRATLKQRIKDVMPKVTITKL
jgi:hypothetical protein